MKKTNYFSTDELRCSHCGVSCMDEAFMDKLNELRHVCGFPFNLTSAYRCSEHPIEKAKQKPGTHNKGIAVDVLAGSADKYVIVKEALKLGFTGIGIHNNFVHLDTRDTVPVIWNY